jgi:hypothetical protein
MSQRAAGYIVALAVIGAACGSSSPAGTSTASPSPTPSSSPTAGREQAWSEDIAYLVERMESLHPDLYHGVSKSDLDAAAGALVSELPTLRDDQILVGVMHLVALISSKGRDGHMGVWPPDNPQAVHRYPIRVWEFPEGLFVTAARAPNEDLAGSRIIAIDGVPIGEVLRRLDPVVPRDNDSNLRAARTVFLTSAEVLSGLRIATDAAHIELEVVDPSGSARMVTIEAVDAATFATWVNGWELLLPPRGDMLLLRDPAREFWTQYLKASRALYVQYNKVSPNSSDVVDEIKANLSSHAVAKIVLDLRNNGGGEVQGLQQLLDFLAEPGRDLPWRLYVLIGRLTFSAAAIFVVQIEQDVPGAILVGEASGGAPNFWADVDTITLPTSALKTLISTTYEGYSTPNDPRLSIEPDVPLDLTAADYFAGRDPVLDAALAAP